MAGSGRRRAMSIRVLAGALVTTMATAVLLLTNRAAGAQTTTATVEGTVTDATGAVLPGVTVALSGETITRSTESDRSGLYRAAALPAGRYTIVATARGFRALRIEGVEVALNHTARVDLRMDVAVQDETIAV